MDFTKSGKAQLARHVDAGATLEDCELWCRNAMEREQLLAERLVTRKQEPAGIAARVGLTHQLEECNDVLVVRNDSVEFLEQVEDDVRLPLGNAAAHLGEAVEHAETAYVMAARAQRTRDVVFSTPLLDLFVAMAFERFRGHQARVHDDERAQFSHSRRWGVSPCA